MRGFHFIGSFSGQVPQSNRDPAVNAAANPFVGLLTFQCLLSRDYLSMGLRMKNGQVGGVLGGGAREYPCRVPLSRHPYKQPVNMDRWMSSSS